MKKILTLILFGFMVTSCSNPKTEEEEVKVKSDFDSIGFIGEIANGNGIGFNRISEDQFTLETKGLETNYSISNGKVTEIVVKLKEHLILKEEKARFLVATLMMMGVLWFLQKLMDRFSRKNQIF